MERAKEGSSSLGASGYHAVRATIALEFAKPGGDRVPLLISCLKCRSKTGSDRVQEVRLKNGREAATSFCAVCGTKKFSIGKIPVEA